MFEIFRQIFESLEARFGQLQVRFWLNLCLFAIACISFKSLLVNLLITPALKNLPYSASNAQLLEEIQAWLTAFALFCVAVAAVLMRLGMVLSVTQHRAKLEPDPAAAPNPGQLKTLTQKGSRLEAQLDSVLDDNQLLRSQLQVAQQEVNRAGYHLKSVVKSSEEAVIVFDAGAKGVVSSSAMAVLLQVRNEDIAGTSAERLLQLFDANKENPREYPLPCIVQQALQSASSQPKLFEVVLLDRSGTEHQLKLSTQAILDKCSKPQGVILHANTASEDGPICSVR